MARALRNFLQGLASHSKSKRGVKRSRSGSGRKHTFRPVCEELEKRIVLDGDDDDDLWVSAGGPYTVNEGQSITLTAQGQDERGRTLKFSWDLDNNGTYETAGQTVSFSAVNLDGTTTRTVRVRGEDKHGDKVTAKGTVKVLNVNPVANTDSSETDLENAKTINVLANDTDVPGDPRTVTAVSAASQQGGSVVRNANGTVTYTPKVDFAGDDSFTYTISDGDGGTATGTVNVHVRPAGIVNGNLKIVGSSAADVISAAAGTPGATKTPVVVIVNGDELGTYQMPNTGKVLIKTFAGDDNVSISGDVNFELQAGTGVDSLAANFAGNYNHTMDLQLLEHATIVAAGDFNGVLTDPEDLSEPGSGHIELFQYGGSFYGTVKAASIDKFIVDFDFAFDGYLELTGAAELGQMTVGGDFAGVAVVPEDTISLESGTVGDVYVGGSFSGDFYAASMETFTVDGDFTADAYLELTGAAELGQMTVGGDFAGVAVVPEDTISLESGTVGDVYVGGSFSGDFYAASMETFTVDGDFTADAYLELTGAAELGQMTVGGDFAGLAVIPEDTISLESGTVGDVYVGGSFSGDFYAASMETFTVDGDFTADAYLELTGAAELGQMTVGGDFAGLAVIPEDTISLESGTVGDVYVGGSFSGDFYAASMETFTVDGDFTADAYLELTGAAELGQMTVGGDFAGLAVIPEDTISLESGTVGDVYVGGSFSGDFYAASMETFTVDGDFTADAYLELTGAAELGQMTVGGDFAGLAVIPEDTISLESGTVGDVYVGGSFSGDFYAASMETFTVDGDFTADAYLELTGAAELGQMTVGGDFAGLAVVPEDTISLESGTVGDVYVGGSFSGDFYAASMETFTVDGDFTADAYLELTGAATLGTLFVSGDFSGFVSVPKDPNPGSGVIERFFIVGSFSEFARVETDKLQEFDVQGEMLGRLKLEQLSSSNASGSTLFNIEDEIGVVRTLSVQTVSSGAVSALTGGADPLFMFFYDATGAGSPQLAVRVLENADNRAFNLLLTTSTADGFDLARLDETVNGASGIRNLAVEGDVLAGISPDTAAYFGLPAGTPGGIFLSQDHLEGVGVAGNIRTGAISAASIQSVAFGSLTNGGTVIDATAATQGDAALLMASGTAFAQADGTYIVPFAEGRKVVQFIAMNQGSNFSNKSLLFEDQVDNHESVIAVVTATPAVPTSTLDSIEFFGEGGSVTTAQFVANITSDGSLGNLSLTSSEGIGNITAPAFIGNIVGGTVKGTIQSTDGDIGRAILSGQTITGVTTIQVSGVSGKIVARGNLVSRVTSSGNVSGVIAAEGDIGIIQRNTDGTPTLDTAGKLTRFGGIELSKLSGSVVSLGNILGDLSIGGGLDGRIAAKGRSLGFADADANAARIGILGNIHVTGAVSNTAAIVSGGLIGNANTSPNFTNSGTKLTTTGSIKGILAAKGDINFGSTGSKTGAKIFEKATGTNADAIDYIFSNLGSALSFDVNSSLDGLGLILSDLASLNVAKNGKLTGTVA